MTINKVMPYPKTKALVSSFSQLSYSSSDLYREATKSVMTISEDRWTRETKRQIFYL